MNFYCESLLAFEIFEVTGLTKLRGSILCEFVKRNEYFAIG